MNGKMTHNSAPHASLTAANQVGPFSSPKPALTFNEQLNLLEQRGLIIGNESFALSCLADISYYRLRGYWLTLQSPDGSFKEHTRFEDIWEIYQLDRDLRVWLWKALSPIEIKLRTQFAYWTSLYGDPYAYLDQRLYISSTQYQHSINRFRAECNRESKTPFVSHNLDKYGELPAWAAVEVMSFGSISRLYGNLRRHADATADHRGIQESISASFKTSSSYLKSWLRHLSLVRNIAAHHGRFYNRVMDISPKMLKSDKCFSGHEKSAKEARTAFSKEFPTFIVLRNIYMRSWPDQWDALLDELVEIITQQHPTVDLSPMDFPHQWEQILRGKNNSKFAFAQTDTPTDKRS